MSLTCPSCGANNAPEHCMGEADEWEQFDQGFGDGPRCDIEHGVCVCGCEECNPSVCRECLEDL